MGSKKPPAPDGLLSAGAVMWKSIVDVYDLRPDELNTLEHICRMTDMIAAIDSEWADEGRPLRTKGSMGQLISHPSVSELRTHRMAINALWRQLKLPDLAPTGADSGDAPVKPNQHRAAAQSGWAAAHGKGA